MMQIDGAGQYTSAGLQVPEHIRLIVQLVYSLHFNLVEHLWEVDDMRELPFSHVLHASLPRVL